MPEPPYSRSSGPPSSPSAPMRRTNSREKRRRSSASRASGATSSRANWRATACQWRCSADSSKSMLVAFLWAPALGVVWQHGEALDLDERIGLEEASDLEERQRGIILIEVAPPDQAQLASFGDVVVAVCHEDRQLHDVGHLAARLMHHRVQVVQRLVELRHQIARRDDAPLGVAGVLPGQPEDAPAARDDAVVEAARLW